MPPARQNSNHSIGHFMYTGSTIQFQVLNRLTLYAQQQQQHLIQLPLHRDARAHWSRALLGRIYQVIDWEERPYYVRQLTYSCPESSTPLSGAVYICVPCVCCFLLTLLYCYDQCCRYSGAVYDVITDVCCCFLAFIFWLKGMCVRRMCAAAS